VRLKDDLETLLSCCIDLNYVNMWYLKSWINLWVVMLDLLQLFRLMTYLMIDIDVMLCIRSWNCSGAVCLV
jgi:hypothetical protein